MRRREFVAIVLTYAQRARNPAMEFDSLDFPLLDPFGFFSENLPLFLCKTALTRARVRLFVAVRRAGVRLLAS